MSFGLTKFIGFFTVTFSMSKFISSISFYKSINSQLRYVIWRFWAEIFGFQNIMIRFEKIISKNIFLIKIMNKNIENYNELQKKNIELDVYEENTLKINSKGKRCELQESAEGILKLSNFEFKNICKLLNYIKHQKSNKFNKNSKSTKIDKIHRRYIKTIVNLVKTNFEILSSSKKEKDLEDLKKELLNKKEELALLKFTSTNNFPKLKRECLQNDLKKLTEIKETFESNIKYELIKENFQIGDKTENFIGIMEKVEKYLDVSKIMRGEIKGADGLALYHISKVDIDRKNFFSKK